MNYTNDIFFEHVPKTDTNIERRYVFWQSISKIRHFQLKITVATIINRKSVSILNEA